MTTPPLIAPWWSRTARPPAVVDRLGDKEAQVRLLRAAAAAHPVGELVRGPAQYVVHGDRRLRRPPDALPGRVRIQLAQPGGRVAPLTASVVSRIASVRTECDYGAAGPVPRARSARGSASSWSAAARLGRPGGGRHGSGPA